LVILFWGVVENQLGQELQTHANDVDIFWRMNRYEVMNRMEVADVRKTLRTGIKIWTFEAWSESKETNKLACEVQRHRLFKCEVCIVDQIMVLTFVAGTLNVRAAEVASGLV
jgi:hypothetical protein